MFGQPKGAAMTSGLPSTWHEVNSADGAVLYWRREHTGYEVWPHGKQFQPCFDMYPIGPLCPTLTHAIVVCRDHMHAASSNSEAAGQ